MATCFAPSSISGLRGAHLNSPELFLTKRKSSVVGLGPKLTLHSKSNLVSRRNHSSPIRAEYRDSREGGGDFVAGFLLGGAIFGTLAYVFAPEIRRSLLNENEHGFAKTKGPIYYDEGLERTRLNLSEKIGQLNSAIDNISSRLRGNNKMPTVPIESDPEVGATM